MSWISLIQSLAFLIALTALVKPLGGYMARVFEGRRTFLSKILGPIERATYRVCGIDPAADQTWTSYAASCLAFGLVNFVLFYALLRLQGPLPLNPEGLGRPWTAAVTPDLSFNTAVSFMTNTSWQSYAGEKTLSYLSQMVGVTVQSFLSAAAGMAVAVAMIRGFTREKTDRIGNFWTDATRSTLYVLLPLSFAGALFFSFEGAIQNFRPYQRIATLEGAAQTIAMGPVASQESIKLLSSDGGGFFNASSAHPFENPTPIANFAQMLLILAIPAGLTYTMGRMTKDQRQGWVLFAAMLAMFCGGAIIAQWSEQAGNPRLSALGVDAAASHNQPGGNMEGKEVRFGVGGSALFSVVSTTSADGAMNSSHDSFTPIGGLVQMFNMLTGEVIFGGTGSGLVSMLLMVMVTVFLAGLMVGRTPEYLCKKIEAREMKMVMLSLVATSACVLVFAALSLMIDFRASGYWNPPGPAVGNLSTQGPHGLSEVLYANASAAGTNGSAFGGLNANTPWFNLILGLEMLVGRYFVLVPGLAIAGNVARKRRLAVTSGTLPTHGPLFVGLLIATTVLVAVLTFFPAISLGPIAEHYLMKAGLLFP